MGAFSQTGPYVPRSNNGFADWVTVLSQGIAANPARYALTPADAAVLVQQAQLFIAAHELTKSESTRNKVTIRDRDGIREAITPMFTGYAQRVKLNAGISDGHKIAIGVRPPHRSHSRRNVPASSPMVMIYGASNGAHTLRYHDSMTPTSPAKPFAAVCLQLFMDVTDAPGSPGNRLPSIERAKFIGSYTRNLFGVAHESKDMGKTATYWARWANRRGDVGPWSVPISFTIAFGGAGGDHAKKASESHTTKAPGENDSDDPSMKLAA